MTPLRIAGLLLALSGLVLLVAIGILFNAPLVPTGGLVIASTALAAAGSIAWGVGTRMPLLAALIATGLGWLLIAAGSLSSLDGLGALATVGVYGDALLVIGALAAAILGSRQPWRGFRVLLAIVEIAFAGASVALRLGYVMPIAVQDAIDIALGLALLVGGLVMWRRRPRTAEHSGAELPSAGDAPREPARDAG